MASGSSMEGGGHAEGEEKCRPRKSCGVVGSRRVESALVGSLLELESGAMRRSEDRGAEVESRDEADHVGSGHEKGIARQSMEKDRSQRATR